MSATRTAGAEPCPPRAEVDGDRAAVERVVVELRRLGVEIANAPDARARDGCSTVRARVALDDTGGIAVAVHGATRGSEGRVVSDAALAAAWIDSWTRDDVDVALWAAPPATAPVVEAVPRVAALEPPSTAPIQDVPPANVTAESRWDRIAIAASYEQTWASDDSTWRGAGASACVRVGGFCLGGRARLAFEPEHLHNSTGVGRSDFSLLATASYHAAIGTMSIAPELGVGFGRLATHRAEGSCKPPMMMMPPPNCDPMMDPNCSVPPGPDVCEPTNPDGTMTPKIFVGDGFSTATYAPRISLALRVAIPLFEHVSLDGLAGWTYSPFAHTAHFDGAKSDIIAPEQIALPGEPSSGYVIGVGVRVGAK